jgi:hypothetical protein
MMKRLGFAILFAFCLAEAIAAGRIDEPTITLYPPLIKATGKYDETRSCFNFQQGARKTSVNKEWHLGYGFANIGGEDFIQVRANTDERSVLKDLGSFAWSDSFEIPVLKPLPELEKGARRVARIDTSAGKLKEWEETNGVFAKAVIGHMYLAHIKTENTDFYALFRIEGLEQGEQCTISWKLVPSPEEK